MAETVSIFGQPTTIDKVVRVLLFPLAAAFSWDQGSYFQRLNSLVYGALSSIEMMGYDRPFMERGITQKAFETAIIQNQVKLNAIIPEGIETYLTDFQGTGNVNIQRVPYNLVDGFMIIDGLGQSTWSTTRRSPFLLDIFRNVPFRCLNEVSMTPNKLSHFFYRLSEDLEEGTLLVKNGRLLTSQG